MFEFGGRSVQVRVDGTDLVLAAGGEERRAELVSLAAGGALLGADLLPDGIPQDGTPLMVDPIAAARLADLYALASAVLERLRSELRGDAEPSDINLWPEHFDIAFEAGAEAAGLRANYGASPGDEAHPEPYFYVGPWTAEVEGELWNATGFAGAQLGYEELLASDDPESAALDFLGSRFRALSGAG